jgi:hypothetical protein
MREPLSLFGWILIVFLVLLILSVNVSLFLGKKKPRKPDNWVSRVISAGREIREPFHGENEKLEELSSRVKRFKMEKSQNEKIEISGDQNEQ